MKNKTIFIIGFFLLFSLIILISTNRLLSRYSVVDNDGTFYQVDKITGKTWLLDGKNKYLQIIRDSDSDNELKSLDEMGISLKELGIPEAQNDSK